MSNLKLVPPVHPASDITERHVAQVLLAAAIEKRLSRPEILVSTIKHLCSPHVLYACNLVDGFDGDSTEWYSSASLKESLKKIPLSDALDALEALTAIPVHINENHSVDYWNEAPFLELLRSVLPEGKPEFLDFLDTMIEKCPGSGNLESEIFPYFVRLAKHLYT